MPKHQSAFKCIAFIIFLSISSLSFAQQASENLKKPKIGLVLSGGGAKGLAHIGVIKVLEEAGIKPDIITGTSMGSIIGALYAAGYTSEEMSKISTNADWGYLLIDKEILQKVSLAEKSESNKYLFSIPVEGRQIDLPVGLIQGQHIENYFSELFWPLTAEEDFNSLPIPFHCVSVDLITGKTYEHQFGDLAKSIRSSMSIPTIFSPVLMDSMLLVDGGVMDNFPVQQALEMGADIIIGVYVGYDEDIAAEDLSSITDILQRSIALAGIVDAKSQFSKCDILIIPELGSYGVGDFFSGNIIEKLGEEAARKQYDEIEALVKKYNLKYKETQKIKQAKKVLISDIEVENLQYLDEKFVRSKSGIHPGDSVSFEDINETISYLYGTQHFLKLTYSLKKSDNKESYILVFHVKENHRALIGIAPNFDNDLGVGLVANITLRNIITPSSHFLASAKISENPGINVALDKKLGKNQRFSDHYFLNAYNYELAYQFGKDYLGRFQRYYFDGGYGIYSALSLNHQLGLNLFYRYNLYIPGQGFMNFDSEAESTKDKSAAFGSNIYYKMNTTDDLYFPKEGNKLEISIENAYSPNPRIVLAQNASQSEYYFPESKNYSATLLIDYNYYKSFAKKFTYNFGLGVGLRTNDPGFSGIFLLGGHQFNNKLTFMNFTGYNFAEIYTQNYSYLKSTLNWEIISGLYLSATANIGNMAMTSRDLIQNFSTNDIGDYYIGLNSGVKYNSILGPIQLLISNNNQDYKMRIHLSLGFPF